MAVLALAALLLVVPAGGAEDTAVIEGTVTDRATGEALDRVEVTVENREAEAFSWNYSTTDGTYRVEIPAGHVLVGFTADQRVPPSCEDTPREMGQDMHTCDAPLYPADYAPEHRGLELAPGEHTLHVQLPRLSADGTGVEGWIVDRATGEPIEDATVIAHEVAGDRWGQTTTDANGSWAFDVEGPVTLQALAEGYRVQAATEIARTPATETVLGLAAGPTLTDRIEHGYAPAPPAEANRTAFEASHDLGPPPTLAIHERGDDQGSFARGPGVGLAAIGVAVAGVLVSRRGRRRR